MCQILIVSDSHRDDEVLENIFNRYPTLKTIHAGDCCYELDDPRIKDKLVVIGNHDFALFPEYIIDSPYFICHGHTFNCYHGFEKMIEMAKKNHCTTIIHGHTHIPFDQTVDSIRIINPGSTMINRGSCGIGTYAILNEKTQQLTFHHHHNHEDVTEMVLEDGKKTLQEFRNLIKEFNL